MWRKLECWKIWELGGNERERLLNGIERLSMLVDGLVGLLKRNILRLKGILLLLELLSKVFVLGGDRFNLGIDSADLTIND